jgi:hypothetical protein
MWTLGITTVGIYSIDSRKVITVLLCYGNTVVLHPPVLSTSRCEIFGEVEKEEGSVGMMC